jgi:methyltransferase (TIGR00027 family)
MQAAKSSKTAYFIAMVFFVYLHRGNFSASPAYRDYVLAEFQRKSLIFRLLSLLCRLKLFFIFDFIEACTVKGFVAHVGARKEIIFSQIRDSLKAEVTQVVLLGAGLDLVGRWLSAQYPQVKFFELDHPASQRQKRLFFPNSQENLRILPCDFTEYSMLGLLQEHNLNPEAGSLFVWEGVTMYLNEADIQRSLKEISQVAKNPLVLFSFMNQRADGSIQFFKAPSWVDRLLAFGSEPFLWGIKRSDLPEFLRRQEWSLLRMWTEHEEKRLIFQSETLALAVYLENAR